MDNLPYYGEHFKRDKETETILTSWSFHTLKAAEYYASVNLIKVFKISDSENFHLYVYDFDNYIWCKTDPTQIHEFFLREIREMSTEENNFKGTLKSSSFTASIDKEVFRNVCLLADRCFEVSKLDDFIDESKICFQNGILDIKTFDFIKYPNKEKLKRMGCPFIIHQLPCMWNDPTADMKATPIFDKFLDDLLGCDNTEDAKEFVLAYIGLIISNVQFSKHNFKKCVILQGLPNSGKSQLIKLIEDFYNKNSAIVSECDLMSLGERFQMYERVYKRRFVYCGDMDKHTLKNPYSNSHSIFKQLTGGDTVSFEKKRGAVFSARFNGFLWFNCNDLPIFPNDEAIFERIALLKANNVLPPEQRDSNLSEKLKQEKNGIVQKCVLALNKVIQNNYRLPAVTSSIQFVAEYKQNTNPLNEFLQECCIANETGGYIVDDINNTDPTTLIQEAFTKWYKVNYPAKMAKNSREFNKLLVDALNVEDIEQIRKRCKSDNRLHYKLKLDRITMSRYGLFIRDIAV